jgi:tetratricopeptide (TPR) repeat protein
LSSLSIHAPIEALKSKGNKAFEIGNYQRALDLYTQAIDEAATVTAAAAASLSPPSPASSTADAAASSSSSTVSSSSPAFPIHTLYSNRSAAYLSLKNYTSALSDAEAAIILAPSWPKGYVRKGQALEQLLRYHEAHRAYKQGLLLDPSDPALCKAAVELATLLEELKISEDELTTAATNPDSDRFAVMVNWLRQAGARFPKLYLQWYSEDYRGVHCLTKIPSEDIILFVPFSAIMTSQVAMDSELGQLIVQSRVELRSKHSYLASYLLQEKEKGKDSYWQPYLACLPAFYHNMPIFFPPRLLAMLKGSFTLQKIQDRIDSLKAEYVATHCCTACCSPLLFSI